MSSQVEGFWSFGRFRVAAVLAALLLFCIGMRFRFAYEVSMPPLPPRPVASAQAVRSLDFSQKVYRALIEKDASDFGISPPAAELEQPFDHLVVEPRRTLVA